MSFEKLQTKLGSYVLFFQTIEAAMAELIIQIADADPEFVNTLTAELPFSAKARALDVMYTRFAQIHKLTSESPDPDFHALAARIQKLANRRNDLVHSFYSLNITVDGSIELGRVPTKLNPSKGARERPMEGISVEALNGELKEMELVIGELEGYRLAVIAAQNHVISRAN